MDDRELVARVLRERVEHLPDAVAEKICFEVSDEILAALAKAGRLASEVKGDVVEEAVDKIAPRGTVPDHTRFVARAFIVEAAPILAADAERRVRAETVAEALAKMTPDQVRDAFGARCWGCGGPTPCHCQNDE